VVVWFAIFKLYGVGLGFGSPNLNLNCYVIIIGNNLKSSKKWKIQGSWNETIVLTK
jgi:hypothetical protein